jgi:hypothetical protein
MDVRGGREGSHLGFSRRGPKPQQLPQPQVLGQRSRWAPAPAQAELSVGTDWMARRDAEQPPDATTAPLRAKAPQASNTGAFNTRATPHSRAQRRAGTRNGPAPGDGAGARRGACSGTGELPGRLLSASSKQRAPIPSAKLEERFHWIEMKNSVLSGRECGVCLENQRKLGGRSCARLG